jgi:sugar O-acyltransferase (sialic acid O-acetyltransferase NeuD family)
MVFIEFIMEKIIIIGGGGHSHSCIDVIEQQGKYSIEGIIDIKEELGTKIMGYPVIGRDEDIPELCKSVKNFHIAIGQIKKPEIRIRLFQAVKSAGGILPVIVSPLAYVSKHATIGEGSIIMHYAVVNAGAQIGVNSIINIKAIVEYDAYVGNHCHVSEGAILNGEAQLCDRSFLGSNAVSLQSVIIPPDSFIKAYTLVK